MNHHHLAGIRVSPYFLESSPTPPPCLPPTCIFLPSFPHGLFQTCYPNFFSTDCPVFPHFLSPRSSECLSRGSQVPPWPPLANLSLCLLPTQRLPRQNCLSPVALIHRSWLHWWDLRYAITHNVGQGPECLTAPCAPQCNFSLCHLALASTISGTIWKPVQAGHHLQQPIETNLYQFQFSPHFPLLHQHSSRLCTSWMPSGYAPGHGKYIFHIMKAPFWSVTTHDGS